MNTDSDVAPERPKAFQVLLAADRSVQMALDRIFVRSNWHLRCVATCREAIEFARENSTPVAICGQYLLDGDWRTVLNEFESLPMRPTLIVTSPMADDALWAEVLNLGGYDVLAQPFDREEVFRVVSLAWRRSKTWSAAV